MRQPNVPATADLDCRLHPQAPARPRADVDYSPGNRAAARPRQVSHLLRIECGSDRIWLGALTPCAEIIHHPQLRAQFPLLVRALDLDAGAKCATAGDQLLQRPCCEHFHDIARQCNKRVPGSGCAAASGDDVHAIFGASGLCLAVQTSDMCVALAALEARVMIDAAGPARSVPFAQFHRLPGTTPELDANLQPGEVATGIELPMPAAAFARHYCYLKIRPRAGDGSSPISVAAALDIRLGVVRAARIALGGVAHKPWRAVQAENALAGSPAESGLYWEAAQAALQPVSRQRQHAFKVELTRQAIVRALTHAANRTA